MQCNAGEDARDDYKMGSCKKAWGSASGGSGAGARCRWAHKKGGAAKSAVLWWLGQKNEFARAETGAGCQNKKRGASFKIAAALNQVQETRNCGWSWQGCGVGAARVGPAPARLAAHTHNGDYTRTAGRSGWWHGWGTVLHKGARCAGRGPKSGEGGNQLVQRFVGSCCPRNECLGWFRGSKTGALARRCKAGSQALIRG